MWLLGRIPFSYQWGGLDGQTGMPIGFLEGSESQNYGQITGTGTDVSDLVYHGSAMPTAFGSIGNEFSYAGFSITARLAYKGGYFFRRQTIEYSGMINGMQAHPDYSLRWMEAGDETKTDIPAFVYPYPVQAESFYKNSEPFVERGDHLRLQYINLAYERSKLPPGFPIRSIRFYAIGNNLGLLWKSNSRGLDPEASMIPPVRSTVFGIKANF